MKNPYSNRWLQLITFAGLALLCWNAGNTTVWDDETNGFFLAKEPLPKLLKLMSANVHEDPPLYDLTLHYWQLWAGFEPFKLRLLSILCWLGALWGLFKCGMRWGGERAGWIVLAVAVWMPYHWMFPAAIRWYSMFAGLTVWNLYGLLCALNLPHDRSREPFRFHGPAFAGYVFSGAAMWYCNYSAPVVFLGQGAALLMAMGLKKGPWLWTIAAWAVIGVCYLPWLPVFFRQLGLSGSVFSFPLTAASLYAIVAGEVSTPYDWWVSLPVVVSALSVAMMAVQTRRVTQFLTVVVVVILGVLVVKNVIWTKRLLIFTPFLALMTGAALASISRSSHRGQQRVKTVFLAAAGLMLTGSLINLVRREGWLTYRWLVPTGQAVADIERQQPDGVILSNSNVVAFYCKDPVGMNVASHSPDRVAEMKMLPFYSSLTADAMRVVKDKLMRKTEAVYIHDSSSVSYSTVMPWVESQMQAAGFVRGEVVPMAMASASYLKHHPGTGDKAEPIDRARLVVVHFRKISVP
ncbi:hypothetical protein [Prosthecobacter sp.]|uniref:hypothetical protein n=1 Tax=Prosthecobacter sp. TaxID=1965333 RepID=UPI0037835C4F